MALFNHLLLTLQSCILSSFLNISITHQSTHPPKKVVMIREKGVWWKKKKTEYLIAYNTI